MTDCVDCRCDGIVTGLTGHQSLSAQNNDKVKQMALMLRDVQLCDLPDQSAKFAYAQWCFNKNLAEQLGWIASELAKKTAYDDSALRAENTKLKATLTKIINNLERSGAWQGGLDGDFVQDRNIASGNTNISGGSPEGSSYIYTSNDKTENDLAGG